MLPRWPLSKTKNEKERKAATASLDIDGDRERRHSSTSGGDDPGSSADDPSTQRHRRRSPSAENRKKIVWTSPATYFTAVQTWYDALTSGNFLLDPEDQAALQRRHRHRRRRSSRHRLSHRRRLFPWSSVDKDDGGEDRGEDTDVDNENDTANEDNDDPYRAADRYLQASEAQEEATMLYKFFPFDTSSSTSSSSFSQHPSPTTLKPVLPASSLAENDEAEIDHEDEVEDGEGGGEGEEVDGNPDRPNFAPSETGAMGLVLSSPSPEDEVPLTIPPTAVLEREETP